MLNSLSRKDNHRHSLMRNLITSFVLYEEMKTTSAKAKEVKAQTEALINKAKKENLQSRRNLDKTLYDKNAIKKVIEVLVPRYKNKKSGFIKTYKIGSRVGDNANMMMLRLDPEINKKQTDDDLLIKENNASKKPGAKEKSGEKIKAGNKNPEPTIK